MTLSINPLAKLIATASQEVSAAVSAAGGGLSGDSFGSLKSSLNNTVGQLSGSLNSGLGPLGGLSSNITSGLGAAQSALGGIGNPIQSIAASAGNAINSATSALGGIAGNAQGLVAGVSNITADIGSSLNKLGLNSGGLGTGLAGLASQISSAAGMLNNILSLGRAKNLPSGAELFQQRGAFVEVTPGAAEDWRVKINCNFGLFGGAFGRLSATNGVVWPYLPNISVSSKANYAQIDPVHNNQPYQAYKNSQIEDITITGEFSCETEMDAEYWIQATTFFKTATKMWFGSGDNVGNPPVICNLSGYGARVFNNVPIIIKNVTINLPSEVNYIKCTTNGSPTWVPVVSEISVTVAPIYNRTRLRKFNLKDYAAGTAIGYI
jgi:hypothetical protein